MLVAQMEVIVWVLGTVGGLLLLLLGIFFKGLSGSVKDLGQHVSVMQTDMAVVKNTLTELLKRDLVTRGEMNAQIGEIHRDIRRVEGDQRSMDERLRSLESGKRGPTK